MDSKRIKQKFYDLLYAFKVSRFFRFGTKSYAQEGEDLILNRIFENQKTGFYVDVGAFHPVRFSNTYFFYKKGWRGINIDARPGSMKIFDKIRRKDINIETPVNDIEQELTYYMFNEPALNTFIESLAKEREGVRNYHITNLVKIKTQRLDDLLDKHLPKNTTIDFLSIDVEGLDINVLKSNNWNKYRPKYVLAEGLDYDTNNPEDNATYKYLKTHNYSLYCKTVNTLFFKCDDY